MNTSEIKNIFKKMRHSVRTLTELEVFFRENWTVFCWNYKNKHKEFKDFPRLKSIAFSPRSSYFDEFRASMIIEAHISDVSVSLRDFVADKKTKIRFLTGVGERAGYYWGIIAFPFTEWPGLVKGVRETRNSYDALKIITYLFY